MGEPASPVLPVRQSGQPHQPEPDPAQDGNTKLPDPEGEGADMASGGGAVASQLGTGQDNQPGSVRGDPARSSLCTYCNHHHENL